MPAPENASDIDLLFVRLFFPDSTRKNALVLGQTVFPMTIRISLLFILAGGSRLELSAEYTRLSRSLWWEPCQYDAGTSALFHLDAKGKKEEAVDFDALDDEPDLDDIGDDETAPAKKTDNSRSAENAVPSGQSAALLGKAAFVEHGRFGGGLKLEGGMLFCKARQKSGWRGVEFWIRLAAYPENRAILLQHVAPPRRASGAYRAKEWNGSLTPLSIVVLKDGTLACEAKKTPQRAGMFEPFDAKLPLGRWVHVSVTVTNAWPHGRSIYLYVNGESKGKLLLDGSLAAQMSSHSEACTIGNAPKSGEGLQATIDEVRVSTVFRSYYQLDLDWPRPNRKFETANGQPWFRNASDLIFHLDFNGTCKPVKCAPGTDYPEVAITENDIEFSPSKVSATYPTGIEGRGLMLGEGSLRPAFSAKGNILTSRGTVAFWMQPVDWDNFTRDYRLDSIAPTSFGLFQLDSRTVKGSNEAVYRQIGPLLHFNANMHLPEGVRNPPVFQPGVWNHVTATWEGTAVSYYIDGQRRSVEGAVAAALEIRTAKDPYPYKKANPRWWIESEPVTLRFRENRYWEQRGTPMPKTIIDDFRIYRRPLAPSEISNLVKLFDPRQKVQPLPEADMQLYTNGVSGTVRAELVPLTESYDEVTTGRLTIRKSGESKPAGQAEASFGKQRQGTVEVRTRPLDFAAYEVLAELLNTDGQVLASVKDSFTRKPPPWWKNKLGLSDKPLPEWDPISIGGNVAKVSLRQIHLGGSGLPERVVSVGEDVLAAPVQLKISSRGQTLALKPEKSSIKVIQQTPARCDWRGSLYSDLVSVSTRAYLEFDGMMWFDVTLKPAEQNASIDAVEIAIPYRKDSAQLVHWWSGRRNFRNRKNVHIGGLPDREGVLFRSNDGATIDLLDEMRGSFIPYVMLTGDQRGMAWFAENDRGWTQSRQTPAVSIARSGETVTLLLKIISERTEISSERTFSFGLHPIPVRRLDPLWRQYPVYSNVYPDTFCGNNLKGRKGPTSFFLYPEDDWDAVKRRINGEGLTKGAPGLRELYKGQMAALKSKGITAPPPQSLTVPGLYWDMQWNGMPRLKHTREWSETWAPDYQYYTPEFIDFVSWAWNDWIEKTDKFVKGAYIDDCWGAPLTRAGGPVTYTLPDGHTQPGFQFRRYRERFKRMRQISHDHGIWPHLTAHTTHTLLIPYHSFFDLILDGEDQYSSPPAQHDFIDHWPLDRMRFMHNAKWGLVTTWLGWYVHSLKLDKWPAWTFRQSRAYFGHMAQHDILWGFDRKAVDRFGLMKPDTVFIPYWQPDPPVRCSSKNVKVTIWKRPKKCLILLVNVGPKRAEVAADFNLARLGFDAGRISVRDADPALLTYFKEDITTDATPDAPQINAGLDTAEDLGFEDDPEKELEETPDKLPLEERRRKDPDGKWEWRNSTLRCPVRRHDYRLFEFSSE